MRANVYRSVAAEPGAIGIIATAFIARVPMSMRALGIVVLLAEQVDSYLVAGIAAGGSTATQALCAPLWARVAGRRGVPYAAMLSGPLVLVFTLFLVWVAGSGGGGWWTLICACLLGGSALPVSALSRGLWQARLDERLRDAAMALEGVQDEISYVLGPALVVGLDSYLSPGVGLATAGFLHAGGCVGLALTLGVSESRRSSARLDSTRQGVKASALVLAPGVLSLLFGYALVGMMFGALDIAVVATAEINGFPSLAGWLLATLALGSTVSGLVYGMVSWKMSYSVRMALFASCLALVLFIPPLIQDRLLLFMVLTIAGAFVAPLLITANSTMMRLLPNGAMVGLAMLSSSITFGMAVGSSLGGFVVEGAGFEFGFVSASVSAALAATLLGNVGRARPPS